VGIVKLLPVPDRLPLRDTLKLLLHPFKTVL
jgi:hypothetical protein